MDDYCRLWCGPPPLQLHIVERAQIAGRPSVLFSVFDRFPHNSRKFDTGLWGIFLYDREYLCRKTKIGSTFLKRRKIFLYPVDSWYAARAPPLLKFGFTSYQISEESEETILHTRYFRKKDPLSEAQPVEWVEMSGKEYYQFVTDPANKGRQFIDMGDVVLECTDAEYKQYKAEDDHSSYILEQQEGWLTVSLSTLEQHELISGEGTIVHVNQSVEETAMQYLLSQELHKALRQLPAQDYRIIYELYLAAPRKTIRQLSTEYGVPVMTLQDRKQKIVSALRTKVVDKNLLEKNQKNFRTNSKKVRNRKV